MFGSKSICLQDNDGLLTLKIVLLATLPFVGGENYVVLDHISRAWIGHFVAHDKPNLVAIFTFYEEIDMAANMDTLILNLFKFNFSMI